MLSGLCLVSRFQCLRQRLFSTALSSDASQQIHPDLTFIPNFFTLREQRILLQTALQKLNHQEGRVFKKRRKLFESSLSAHSSDPELDTLFLPDEYYRFEEVSSHGLCNAPKLDPVSYTGSLRRCYQTVP